MTNRQNSCGCLGPIILIGLIALIYVIIKYKYDERCKHEEKLRARREYNEMFEEWQERNEKVFQQSDLNKMIYEDDMEDERRKNPQTYKK